MSTVSDLYTEIIAHRLTGTLLVGSVSTAQPGLPVHAVEAGIESSNAGFDLIAHELSGSIAPGRLIVGNTGGLVGPAHEVAGTIAAGSVASVTTDLIAHGISASTGVSVRPGLLVHDVSGEIVGGAAATAAFALPAPSVEATLVSTPQGGGVFAVLAHEASGTIISGSVASAQPALLVHGHDALLVPGSVAQAAFDLIARSLLASGYAPSVISGGSALALPAHTLAAQILSAVPAATTVDIDQEPDSALAVNLATGAVTTYRRFRFNSFGTLPDGRHIAAGSGGLFLLAGSMDDDNPIEWIVSLPPSSMGSSTVKRLAAAYVTYRSGGRVEVAVRADDRTEYAYVMDETRDSGLYRNRVKFGRGMLSSNYALTLSGRADFSLTDLELDVAPTDRRRL